MSHLKLADMQRRTRYALEPHADERTLNTIIPTLTTSHLADMLHAHRQITDEQAQRWHNRRGLTKEERKAIQAVIFASWQCMLSSGLVPWIVLTYHPNVEESAEKISLSTVGREVLILSSRPTVMSR